MRYEILISKPATPQHNMECDTALLASLRADPRCIVHFYEWQQPSATYGYFIDPDQFFNRAGVDKHALQLARRPTGGGIIFHTSDLAFSLLIPSTHPRFSLRTLDNYARVNQAVVESLEPLFEPAFSLLTVEPAVPAGKILSEKSRSGEIFLTTDAGHTAGVVEAGRQKKIPEMGFSRENFSAGAAAVEPAQSRGATDAFCMAKPTRYDVMWRGRKVGGAAQRRVRHGLLHQGTIALGLPEEAFLCDILKTGQAVAEAMAKESLALFTGSLQQLAEVRGALRCLLWKNLRRCIAF